MGLSKSLVALMDGLSNQYSFIFGVLIAFVIFYRRPIYIILKTLPRDLSLFFRVFNTAVACLKYIVTGETIISLFKKTASTNPDKVIVHFQDTAWTVKELDLYSNKVARIFQKKGYKKGDVVALMSLNRPQYIGIWLGLGKIGVVTALINTNLRSHSLAHCVNVAKCKAFVFGYEFAKDVKEIVEALDPKTEYMAYGEGTFTGAGDSFLRNCGDMEQLLSSVSDDAVEPETPIGPKDKLLYIYTSGTTGLPKAAIMVHDKLVMIVAGFKYLLKLRSNDIIYDPLPLYHTAGGLLGTLPALVYGLTVVIKVKFSASKYFTDCVKYKCTIGQYIGEICRYLLAVPPSQNDVNHSLRMVIGNGMRPDVWREFVHRFRIPTVLELYGSTEGNANIMNFDNTIGAVGFLPRILPAWVYPIALIKYDETNGEPLRNENGFCIRCNAGESGMCIGMISKRIPLKDFQGYVDQKETNKKIIKNVFKRGDSAFLSGDILYMDEFGYLYFKDRTGDTFRWKGENVSTGEVEMVIQKLIGFKDCTVYGVQVGDLEGKAGMVAIVDPKYEIDLDNLADGIDKNLPVYARPLFLRILPQLELTGTYKVKKTDLKNETFDPSKTNDRLYFKHSVKGFLPITESLYSDIVTGAVKV
ncbi:long-chain fatty acid transport protein 4-like isoform X1 [Planococcus citri]|uniref:long-chain fatty acid transport protein 4-like isoform X1 n=2 Tax=Planococcus citri TaxID=170843 RepID=UPI0031FA45CD